MAEQEYTLAPLNSIMEPAAPVQLGRIEPEASEPMAPMAPQQPASIQDQIMAAQQKMGSYQSYGQKHPILAQMANLVNQQSGMNPMYDANGMGFRDNVQMGQLQRQAQALQAMHQAQQQAATNKAHLGMYNSIAGHAGLPNADPDAVMGKDELTLAKDLVSKYGAPSLMKALQNYHTDLSNYTRAQQDLETYNNRKRLGQTDLNKETAPVVPSKPELNLEGINPYLEASTVSGVTGSSNEAAKTGEESGADAATNATALEGNKTQLAKLQAEINDRADKNQIAREQMGQTDKHFGVTSGQEERKIKVEETKAGQQTGSKTQQYLLQDAKSARDHEHKTLNTVQDLNKQLVTLVGKVPAGKIHTDPRYVQLNTAYRQAQHDYNQAKSVADEKQARSDRYSESHQEAPAIAPSPTPSLPVRQSGSQQPVKIKISRAEAQRLGLIK